MDVSQIKLDRLNQVSHLKIPGTHEAFIDRVKELNAWLIQKEGLVLGHWELDIISQVLSSGVLLTRASVLCGAIRTVLILKLIC